MWPAQRTISWYYRVPGHWAYSFFLLVNLVNCCPILGSEESTEAGITALQNTEAGIKTVQSTETGIKAVQSIEAGIKALHSTYAKSREVKNNDTFEQCMM